MARNLPLDQTACASAASRLTSLWSGSLRFFDGRLGDELQRTDRVQMTLDLDCLNASLGLTLDSEQLSSACSELSGGGMSCGVQPGGCDCTVESSERVATSGPYGVAAETADVRTRSGEGLTFVDYCVSENLLQWQDPDSGQRLLLRRSEPAAPQPPLPSPR